MYALRLANIKSFCCYLLILLQALYGVVLHATSFNRSNPGPPALAAGALTTEQWLPTAT